MTIEQGQKYLTEIFQEIDTVNDYTDMVNIIDEANSIIKPLDLDYGLSASSIVTDCYDDMDSLYYKATDTLETILDELDTIMNDRAA
jgi:hypothetical protein